MYWKVTGKWRGKRWRDEYCGCCGQPIDEYGYDSSHAIDLIIDKPYAEDAVEQAMIKAGIENEGDGEWLEPIIAIPLPTDQVMLRVGAPMLFKWWQMDSHSAVLGGER